MKSEMYRLNKCAKIIFIIIIVYEIITVCILTTLSYVCTIPILITIYCPLLGKMYLDSTCQKRKTKTVPNKTSEQELQFGTKYMRTASLYKVPHLTESVIVVTNSRDLLLY